MSPFVVSVNLEDSTRVDVAVLTGEVPVEEYVRRHVKTPYVVLETMDQFPPHEPEFAGAIQLKEGQLVINLTNARDLWRNHLRQMRIPLFAALDIEYMRAMEREDKDAAKAIAIQKQKLRDAPAHPAIVEAETTEALKQLTLHFLISGI